MTALQAFVASVTVGTIYIVVCLILYRLETKAGITRSQMEE